MNDSEKFNELVEFLIFHMKKNPEIKMKDLIPLFNEFMHRIKEPSLTIKILEKKKK